MITNEGALSKRITNKYNTAYSYLDEWEQIGHYKTVASKIKHDEDGMKSIVIIEVNHEPEQEPDEVRDSIYEVFQWSCRHEHDCCGCMNGGANQVRKLRNKLWAVRISAYRNI